MNLAHDAANDRSDLRHRPVAVAGRPAVKDDAAAAAVRLSRGYALDIHKSTERGLRASFANRKADSSIQSQRPMPVRGFKS